MTNIFKKGRGQGHVSHFQILGLDHVFGIGETRQFKFGGQIDTNIYQCIYDKSPTSGMCLESSNLCKVWKITVCRLIHRRNGRLIENRIHVVYRMTPIQVTLTLSGLDGHFCYLKAFLTFILQEI